MLTSFGIERSLKTTDQQITMFHGMPPVSVRGMNQAFMPDYELLLLCDSVIMDEESFDRLIHRSPAAYSDVAAVFEALKSDGRVEMRDFSSVLKSQAELLRRIIEYDIKLLDQWVVPLRESLTLWQNFSRMSMEIMRAQGEEWSSQAPLRDTAWYSDAGLLDSPTPRSRFSDVPIGLVHFGHALSHEVAHMMHNDKSTVQIMSLMVAQALESSEKRKRKEYRDYLRDVLRSYLAYVDANLILSHELGVGFHDWQDFTPFYAAKFLAVGRENDPVEERRGELEKLFTVPFPDLAIRNIRSFMKAINDKRIDDLRQLVGQAARGEVEFDNEFAKSVLVEVLRVSERARRWRNVLGYATMPIGFIPWIGTPVQKAVEEGVGRPLERRLKEKHRWFYMLSEVADSENTKANKAVDRTGGLPSSSEAQ